MSQYPPQQPWGQPPGQPNQGDQQAQQPHQSQQLQQPQQPQQPRPQFQRPQFQRLPQSQPLPPQQSRPLPPQQSQPLSQPLWQQPPQSQSLPQPQWQQPPLPPQQQGQPPTPPKKPLGKRRIAIACAIVAVLLVSGVLGVSAFAKGGSSSPSKKTTTATQAAQSTVVATTAPTTKPTTRPTPQSTSKAGPSVTHGTPRIGGSLSDFVGKYGQPNKYSAPPAFYRFLRAANSSTDGLIVGVDAVTNLVNNITWTNTGNSGWVVSEAQAQCMAFAPTDAQLKQRVSYHDGTGYDLVYTSTTLAHLFHSDEFTDVNGQAVAAGTFDVAYIYTSDRQHIADCQIVIGDQQTQR